MSAARPLTGLDTEGGAVRRGTANAQWDVFKSAGSEHTNMRMNLLGIMDGEM